MNEISVLLPDWDVADRVVALSTLRSGGVSQGAYAGLNIGTHVGDLADHVEENRHRLLAGLDPGVRIQWLEQVHGKQVKEAVGGKVRLQADAAFTTQAGLACCVMTADCLPVFIASKSGVVVAMAHAGWRGLAAGVLENTIAALPVAPVELTVWLGPAIGPCHFEVGQDVLDSFLDSHVGSPAESIRACFAPGEMPGKYRADLYALARLRLQALGVGEIGGGGYCTYCDGGRFYSFRRQPTTGRMANLIYLR